jgi:hypothetical protein
MTQQHTINGVWRDGPLLVTAPGARLPCRCFLCNAPVTGKTRRATLKLSQQYFGLGQVGRALADLHAATATVLYGTCPRHTPRVSLRAVGWSLIAASPLPLILTFSLTSNAIAGLISLGVTLGLLLTGLMLRGWPPPFELVRWEANRAWVTGFSDAYLEPLPTWQSEQSGAATALEEITDDQPEEEPSV